MASKLKIIPLGGLGEIGKNMTVFEYGNDMIVVDCGISFPDDDMPGIDVVIPDMTYLRENRAKFKGFMITHGHEDHIGALPYALKEFDAKEIKSITHTEGDITTFAVPVKEFRGYTLKITGKYNNKTGNFVDV